MAGDRHARNSRPSARGAEHHRNAVSHSPGPSQGRRSLLPRHIGAVRLPTQRSGGALPEHQAPLRKQAARRRPEQGRPHAARGLEARRQGPAGLDILQHGPGHPHEQPERGGRQRRQNAGLRQAPRAPGREQDLGQQDERHPQQDPSRRPQQPGHQGSAAGDPRDGREAAVGDGPRHIASAREGPHARQWRRRGLRPGPAQALPAQGSRVEVRHHPRDHRWQEHRGLCRPGDSGAA
mmetsp:Transcript_7266/g.12436  ORF Transcript_7266/g.12436 Transcript_7266/m.12436 type:complete len:236 (+) Transcript_7266:729-1436(+)